MMDRGFMRDARKARPLDYHPSDEFFGLEMPMMDQTQYGTQASGDVNSLLSGSAMPASWSGSQSALPYNCNQYIPAYSQGGERSSQIEVDEVEEVPPVIETVMDQRSKKITRSKNFCPWEDKVLIVAWVNVGLDPITGNNQTNARYWECIKEY